MTATPLSDQEAYFQIKLDLLPCLGPAVSGSFQVDLNYWFFCENGNLSDAKISLEDFYSPELTRHCGPGLVALLYERKLEQDIMVTDGALKGKQVKARIISKFSHQDGKPCLGQLVADNNVLFADGCFKLDSKTTPSGTDFSQQIFSAVLAQHGEEFYQSGSVALIINNWHGTALFELENNVPAITYDLSGESDSVKSSFKKPVAYSFVQHQVNFTRDFIYQALPFGVAQ